MKKVISFIICSTLCCISCFALDGNPLANLDAVGNNILVIMRTIGFWVVLIKGIADIIKCAASGDRHGVVSIVILCLTIYGAIYALPWAMRLIEDIFQ